MFHSPSFGTRFSAKTLYRKAVALLLVFALLGLPADIFAQRRKKTRKVTGESVSTLEQQQKNLEQQVAQTEKMLDETRGSQKRSFAELKLLKQEIGLREKLLGTLNMQLSQMDGEISGLDRLVISMENDIAKYQQSYAKASVLAYKMEGDVNHLLWVFSSDGFRQAFDRIMYFKEFARYRKTQIFLVKRTQTYLASKKRVKEDLRLRHQRLLGRRETEVATLDKKRSEQDKLLVKLKKNESEYEKKLGDYKKELAQIREKIKQLVLESRKTAGKETAELKKLSNVFAQNKGRLPWPVSMQNGVVTGYFGKTETEMGAQVINDGIYITTPKDEAVRAVFAGKVTMISKVPSYGQVVIVQHGSYRTVYANLEEVSVNKGDDVPLMASIGKVKTHTGTGETQLYFQIYKDFNPVNPLAWIADKK